MIPLLWPHQIPMDYGFNKLDSAETFWVNLKFSGLVVLEKKILKDMFLYKHM
jgi:hypothetical protein